MTVSTNLNRDQYAGDGVQTNFTVTFLFFANVDLEVTVKDAITGVESVKVLDMDYTVTGSGTPPGGTVTFTTAPVSGDTITILRIMPLKQEVDYQPNDPFPAETHEQALDISTMGTQQLDEEMGRAVKFAKSSTQKDVDFPEPKADEAIFWNSAATKLITKALVALGALGIPVSILKGGTNATTASAARTNLGLGTAAVENVGVADGDVPQMDAVGYPAADGSQITGIAAGPAQATQAALEAETNEDTYAPPDLLQHSPGVAKAWADFTIAGSVNASKNVSSVTDTGTGDWRVNLTTAFSTANYAIIATPDADPNGGTAGVTGMIDGQATGTYDVRCANKTADATDPARGMYTVAFGDQ